MLLDAMFKAPDEDVKTVLVDAAAARGDGPVRLLRADEAYEPEAIAA